MSVLRPRGIQTFVEETSRAVDRYTELVALQRALHERILRSLPRRVVEETAHRLGLAVECDADLALIDDAAIYDTGVLARFAGARTADERLVLAAMRDAYPTVLEILGRGAGRGVRAYDVLADRDEVLIDLALSDALEPGAHVVARVLRVEGVAMTTGATKALESRAAQRIAQAPPLPATTSIPGYRAAVATNLYRLALSAPTNDPRSATRIRVASGEPLGVTLQRH